MSETGFTVFDTAIGRCALAWSARGITGLHLPEPRESATRTEIVRRFPDAREANPPEPVRRAIDAIVALLQGESIGLTAIALDTTNIPPFHARVYAHARAIGPGATITYGELAKRVGAPGAARAVGQAMGRNPFPIIVPCHRVLAAGGRIGGFSAAGGVATKQRILAIEDAAGVSESFEFDPGAALAHLRKVDPAIAQVIDRTGAFRMRIKSTPSIFAALAEAIVYQQLSGRAAATIYGRLCALFPRAHHGPEPKHILRATDARLRGAGLSAGKTLALRDLARRTVAGELPTLAEAKSLDNTTLIERLTAVRGIGQWTVEMLLMFRLGRPDVLPAADLGIRKGFAVATGKRALPTPEQVLKYGARWAPYRTVASWYLWRAAE